MLFEVAKFRFHFLAQDQIIFPPYKGSTFRGGFGYTFKKVVCVNRETDCHSCLLRTQCVYSYVFETPLTETKGLLPTTAETAPHPFVIEPPETRQTLFKPGETLELSLVLIGRGIDYLPYFIFTFDELGHTGVGKGRGKLVLQKVFDSSSETGEEIYHHVDKILSSNFKKLTFSDLVARAEKVGQVHQLQLKFHTPTRIKYQNQFTDQLEFHLVIRNLLRRITNLAVFHGEGQGELAHQSLIAQAEKVATVHSDLRWYDWERYSTRQDERMKLGGVVGELVVAGDLKEFLPYLFLGELIHVGKGTAFGLGRYEVTVLE